MKRGREARLGAAVVCAFLCLGCGGNVYYHQGRKAELHKDYDTALVDFEKAVQSQPDNALYLLHEKLARTKASEFHVRQAKRLLAEGRQADAAGELQKAVGIDPTNALAAQELARIMTEQAAAKREREKTLQQAMKPSAEAAPAGVELKAFSQEPIAHIHVAGDSKKVYETLGKLGELNVAFLQEVPSGKTVSLDLVNIKLEDALRILGYETKTFWKPITSNTILVIPDNLTTHREYDDRVLKTVYLTNPLQPADRTQILTAVRQILAIQTVVDNPEANAIIVSGTRTQVEAAEKIIHDLDHGKAEVLIEVAILEADRDRIRDLGIAPVPTSPLTGSNVFGLGFTPPGSGGSSSSAGTISALPLNKLGRISTADFSVVMPGAVANALMNDSRSRIIQNPEIRTTDGQKAELKIGSEVPFATGSFLPSFTGTATTGAAGGFGLLASTQFQYKDVGVNLTITPHVLPDGEVSLHAKIEITSVGPSVTIGGLSEPTFTQRTIEHDIRMKEGEVNVLGGLVQSTTTNQVTGLPGLADIPLLRYFFSTEHRERNDQEILVMLTPHIVRLPEFAESTATGIGAAAPGVTPPPGINFPPNVNPQPLGPQN